MIRLTQSAYPNRQVGLRGESIAVDFYRNRGYRLLRRNYRCRMGELDLVVADHQSLVFVEVKTRHVDNEMEGLESISFSKRKRLLTAARHFLQRYRLDTRICRFDMLLVILLSFGRHRITWLKNVIEE